LIEDDGSCLVGAALDDDAGGVSVAGATGTTGDDAASCSAGAGAPEAGVEVGVLCDSSAGPSASFSVGSIGEIGDTGDTGP
jgi:hypothetical protein